MHLSDLQRELTSTRTMCTDIDLVFADAKLHDSFLVFFPFVDLQRELTTTRTMSAAVLDCYPMVLFIFIH
jgi:hypothetical protein